MYRHILRAMAAVALLVSFWSAVRLDSLSIFDWAATVVVLASLPYRSRDDHSVSSAFGIPILGLYVFAFAGIVSMNSSSDLFEHVRKVLALLAALSMMLAFAYALSTKKILSLTEALTLLTISGAISSSVVILQGQLGILTYLVPNTPHGIEEWNRLTGLAEHPIEAGMTSAFSVVIALGLATYSRRWLLYLSPAIVGVYSMKYSASLTANLALALGVLALYLVSRAYSALIGCVICGGLIVGVALSYDTLGPLLESRFQSLARDQGDYETLKYRQVQLEETLGLIDLRVVAVGKGYSTADLPDQMDIHNGLIASLFHFGAAGLSGQCLLIWFFVSKLWGNSSRSLRGVLMGCILVFATGYLTGPPFARRSVWIPMLLLGAYLPSARMRKHPFNLRHKKYSFVTAADCGTVRLAK